MPQITANEVLTYKHIRDYIQFGGPLPGNLAQYYGQDAQYMAVEGVKVPEGNGKIDPIWVADPRRIGKYRLVGRKVSPPDLAEATLKLYERHGAIPRQLSRINCPFNHYQPAGTCKDLSDFLNGWSDYVMVYSGALVDGSKDLGTRTSIDKDEVIEDSLPLKLNDIYPIGALSFGDNAQTIVTLEVIDAIYGSREQCGECQPADDGAKNIYAVTKSSGSTPGTAPKFIYSNDWGVNWTQGTVTGLGDTEDPISIDVVGKYLVITTQTAGGPTISGYYYAEIDNATGIPGTWTKVTTGFSATYLVNDVYVLSPREVYFCANGGAIYKSSDITAGVDWALFPGTVTSASLKRIHGQNETIVSVGASGTVVFSANRGKTWATATASPINATLQALAVVNDNVWWVGANNGSLWYTLTGGAVWAQKRFSGDNSGQVRDVICVTDEVLFFSHDTATPTARIFSTWDGGQDWTNTGPRINNMPTASRFNRLACPDVDNAGLAANTIVVAGLSGGGSDGILLQGLASRL